MRHPTLRPLFNLLLDAGHYPKWCTKEMFLGDQFPAPDTILIKNGMEDPQILAHADELLARGIRIINSPASTRLVEDRLATDYFLATAGLPVPPHFLGPFDGANIPLPYFQKPRSNYAHYLSLVTLSEDVVENPFYYYQQVMPNDGVVRKLYVIGHQVFLVTRDGAHIPDFEQKYLEHRVLHKTPPQLQQWALKIGSLTGLEVFGVDVIGEEDRFFIIDVNPFPGFHGVPQAPEYLLTLLLAEMQ